MEVKRGEKLLGMEGSCFNDEEGENLANGFKQLKLIIGPDLSPLVQNHEFTEPPIVPDFEPQEKVEEKKEDQNPAPVAIAGAKKGKKGRKGKKFKGGKRKGGKKKRRRFFMENESDEEIRDDKTDSLDESDKSPVREE